MIGYLKGSVIKTDGNNVIVNTGNVGYKVMVSNNTQTQLMINDLNEFFIHTHVREDQLVLFGFLNYEDLKIFELLLDVSGIGPKIALQITGNFTYAEIIEIIQKADVDKLSQVQGISKKGAQKVILELQSKIGKINEIILESINPNDEALDALMHLGFTKTEAQKMLKDAPDNLSTEDRIKFALSNR